MKKLIIAVFAIISIHASAQEIMSLPVESTDSTNFIMHPAQLQVKELSIDLTAGKVLLQCTTIDRGDYDTAKYKSFSIQYVSTVEMDIPTYTILKQAYENKDYNTLNAIFSNYSLEIKQE